MTCTVCRRERPACEFSGSPDRKGRLCARCRAKRDKRLMRDPKRREQMLRKLIESQKHDMALDNQLSIDDKAGWNLKKKCPRGRKVLIS